MIDIVIDDRALLDALNNLQQASSNLRPALKAIGQTLKKSTQQRFSTLTGPDGERWAGNKDSTIERKGRNQPLTDGGILGDTIDYQLFGNDSVGIGSPIEDYAAMQQFGGTKEEFTNLWGDIPARPFLGVSDDDEDEILSIIQDHLLDALGR
jgi:phage virion morphogenesis protein